MGTQHLQKPGNKTTRKIIPLSEDPGGEVYPLEKPITTKLPLEAVTHSSC